MDNNEAGLIAWFKRLFASIRGKQTVSAEEQVLKNIRKLHKIQEKDSVKPSWIDDYIEYLEQQTDESKPVSDMWANDQLLRAAKKLRIATYLKER